MMVYFLRHKPLKIALFALCCLNLVEAQLTAQNPTKKEIANYTFRVIYMDYQLNAGSQSIRVGANLKFLDGGEIYQIGSYAGTLSRSFNYSGPANLIFYKEELNEGGEEQLLPLVSASLGSPGQKVILVVQDFSGDFHAFAYDIGVDKFKLGYLQVLNLSNQTVGVRIGEEKAMIAPMKAKNYKLKSQQNRFLTRFAIAVMEEDATSIIENRRLAVSMKKRKLIIIHRKTGHSDEMTYSLFAIEETSPTQNISDDDLEALDLKEYQEPTKMPDGL